MDSDPIPVFRREPTTNEIAEAKAEIHVHEEEVAMLNGRIFSLQNQIISLKSEQAGHIRTINKHKGVITLARRIPPELLARIFARCVKDGWYLAPVVVSCVCSQWREAARSPRVWSRLYLNLEDANAVGRAQFWLRMASNAPLHIHLIASRMISAHSLLRTMGILLHHASEWRTLTMEVETLRNVSLVSLCLKQAAMQFLKLKRISIKSQPRFEADLDDGIDEIIDFATVLSPNNAPNLMQLFLTCNAVPTTMIFPSRIHNLSLAITESSLIRPLSARSITSLLVSLPHLTSLDLSMPLEYAGEYVDDGELEGATLPRLVSLTLHGPTNMNGLLCHLHAPSLRRLRLRSIEDKGFRQDPIGPSLLRFIRRSEGYLSNFPLEVFELYDIDLSPDCFASCFSSLPNLRELRLHESSISDATVRLLQAGFFDQEASGCLCPKLTKIDFRWCANLTGQAVVDLVRSRVPTAFMGSLPPFLMPGQFIGSDDAIAYPINEVAILNCCYVLEQDILDLARMTLCRVVVEESDHCGELCYSSRYYLD